MNAKLRTQFAGTLPPHRRLEQQPFSTSLPPGLPRFHRWMALILGMTLVLLACAPALAGTLHVWQDSPGPGPPFATWSTAATNIQDAVDAAMVGDEIVVTNGIYQTGARAVYGMSNRVAVTKPVTVRSVNGPDVTQIVGFRDPVSTNGPAAVRCVYLTNGAVLAGFTLTNGATRTSGDWRTYQSGGGVWCEGLSATVSNCVLTGNSAGDRGSGAFDGTLNNCTLAGNSAFWGGGAYWGTLNNCTLTGNSADYGGGTYWGTLNHCVLMGNSAFQGGGAVYGTLNNCTLTGNSAGHGGGAHDSTLNNCTLAGNSASNGGGASWGTLNHCVLMGNSAIWGGGANHGTLNNCTLTGNSAFVGGGGALGGPLYNCIVLYNTAPNAPNYLPDEWSRINYSCTTPMPTSGIGNITNAPLFVDLAGGNLRLQSNSPCINAGANGYANATTDLDGLPRIVGGTVDMGAYEFQSPASQISTAWLQQFGLPTDGSADSADSDGDFLNTWQEWQADTNPTNALSYLKVEAITHGSTVRVTFQSSAARLYTLYACTNLTGAIWAPVPGQTDIPGTGAQHTLTDPAPGPKRFYRVGVRMP